MRHIRPRLASTTWHRKLWQIEAFFKYLAAKEKNPANVTRADVEEYLSGLTCSQQFRQAMCAVVREFYEFQKIRHPHTCPAETRLPVSSSRQKRKALQSPESIFRRWSSTVCMKDEIYIRDRLMAELIWFRASSG